ncbi:MAG: Ig-like domain-containing protein [Bacteroidetes bacterium]|nr:Ig-like domain-containing protein [Bacteroidota bacterium]
MNQQTQSALCQCHGKLYDHGTSGGTWSSSNNSVATVNSSTGVVTAVGAGTANITYTVSGCGSTVTAFKAVTVNANVTAGTVSGTNPLCVNGTATYLSNGTSGGTWSSSNTSVATVNPSTGAVTAAGAGTANITYKVNSGCGSPVTASKTLTVTTNVTAGTVSGTSPLCVNATASYMTSGTSGGTWSSSNNSVATVNSSTGVVTAVGAGTANITYTVSGCGSTVTAFKAVTVNAKPTADAGPDKNYSNGSIPIGGSPTAGGGTSPYTYRWSPAVSLSSTTTPNPSVTGITTTKIYTVTVTDSKGCTASSSVTVNYVPVPPDTCKLSVSPNSVYISDTGVVNKSFSVDLQGTNCSWSIENTCSTMGVTGLPGGSILTDSMVTYSVPKNPDTIERKCILKITLHSSPPQTYFYTINQKAGSGGDGKCVETLSTPSVSAKECWFSVTTEYHPDSVAYQWYFDGGMIANGTSNNLFANSGDGDYYVRIRSLYDPDCDVYSSPMQRNCPVGIEETFIQNLSIVPNPSNGNFKVTFESYQNYPIEIRIFDIVGRLVYEEQPVKATGLYSREINLGIAAKGFYILQLKAGEVMLNRRWWYNRFLATLISDNSK